MNVEFKFGWKTRLTGTRADGSVVTGTPMGAHVTPSGVKLYRLFDEAAGGVLDEMIPEELLTEAGEMPARNLPGEELGPPVTPREEPVDQGGVGELANPNR